MAPNTESEPAEPVIAEPGQGIGVTGDPGTPSGLPGFPGSLAAPAPGFAVVSP